MIGRRLMLAAALLAPACAGDPVAITVKMSLDPESCEVSEPDALKLRCAATAGVWLRSGPGSGYLQRACVDFAAGEDTSLALLPALLAGVELATTASEAIWVEVAVYGPWSSTDGCLHPDDLEGEVDEVPELIVWGESQPIDLTEGSRTIEVVLSCLEVARPAEPDPCEALCRSDEEACFDRALADECLETYELCTQPCRDPTCAAACEGEYDGCLANSPDGICELQFQGCAGDCQTGDCFDDCLREQDQCIEVGCGGVFEDCAESCSDGPLCGSIEG